MVEPNRLLSLERPARREPDAGRPQAAQRVGLPERDVEDVLAVRQLAADDAPGRAERREREPLHLGLERLPRRDARADGAVRVGLVVRAIPGEQRPEHDLRLAVGAVARSLQQARRERALLRGRAGELHRALEPVEAEVVRHRCDLAVEQSDPEPAPLHPLGGGRVLGGPALRGDVVPVREPALARVDRVRPARDA